MQRARSAIAYSWEKFEKREAPQRNASSALCRQSYTNHVIPASAISRYPSCPQVSAGNRVVIYEGMHDPNGRLKDQTSQPAYSFRTLLYICPMRSAMSPPTFCGRVVLLVSLTASLLAFCSFAGQPTNKSLQPNEKADSILILKKEHRLELLFQGNVIRTYKVALGRGGLAPKEREGDGRTPEGRYVIDAGYANSAYHRALRISYPNAEDRKRAAKLGVLPGGAIMIHGLPNGKGWVGASHRLYDWTLGCVAVTDPEIEEIWKLVAVGTPVEIRP